MNNEFIINKNIDVIEFGHLLKDNSLGYNYIFKKENFLVIETDVEYNQDQKDLVVTLINTYEEGVIDVVDIKTVKKNDTITPGFYEVTYEEIESDLLRPGVYRFDWKFKYVVSNQRMTVLTKIYIDDVLIEDYIQTPYSADDSVVVTDFEYIELTEEKKCKIRLDVKQLTSKGYVQFKKFICAYQRIEKE